MSCNLATKTGDLFALISIFLNKLNRSYEPSLRKEPFLLAPRRWGRFAKGDYGPYIIGTASKILVLVMWA